MRRTIGQLAVPTLATVFGILQVLAGNPGVGWVMLALAAGLYFLWVRQHVTRSPKGGFDLH